MSDDAEKKIGRAVGEGLGMKKKEPVQPKYDYPSGYGRGYSSYDTGYRSVYDRSYDEEMTPRTGRGRYSVLDDWDDDLDDALPSLPRERGAAHHKPTPPSTSKTTGSRGRDSIAMSHVVTVDPPVKFGKYVPVNKAFVLDDLTVQALKREIVSGISRTCDELGLVFSPGLRDRVSELAEDVLFEGAYYDRRNGYYLLRREGEEDE
jgi:hypothetical protein